MTNLIAALPAAALGALFTCRSMMFTWRAFGHLRRSLKTAGHEIRAAWREPL